MDLKVDLEYREMAFNRRMLTFAVVNRDHIDIKAFLFDAFTYYEREITEILNIHTICKVNTCFSATFEKDAKPNASNDNENTSADAENIDAGSGVIPMDADEGSSNEHEPKKEKQTLYLHTRSIIIDFETDLHEIFENDVVKVILNKVDEAILLGSGFKLKSINELLVQVNRFEPIRGTSYFKLPEDLVNRGAIINVKNNDDKCFMWAILSAKHRVRGGHAERLSNYVQYRNELDFTGIDFPVRLQDITKFEKLNPSISINVYMYGQKEKNKERKVLPVRITNEVKMTHVHLLLAKQTTPDGDENSHYCWISNLSRLISKQVSNHHGKLHICDRCLNYFHNKRKLEEHLLYCRKQNDCGVEMPTEESDILEFKNFKYQFKVPFIIYADIETLLKKPTEKFSKTETTMAYQEHEPYSIGYYFKCAYDDSLSFYDYNRGPGCIEWFMEELRKRSLILADIYNKVKPINMSKMDEENFQNAKVCHICERDLDRNVDIVVRDHCHFTSKFRGAAHQACNLQYRKERTVPVVFHNLSNYDSHFLIRKLKGGTTQDGAVKFDGSLKVISINTEKYISFIKTAACSAKDFRYMVKFKFIDSFRFMASSLDYLASLIPSEKKTLLRKEFHGISEDQMQLLEQKGKLCYDHIDSWEKLEEDKLPPQDAFHSKLTNQNISEADYKFAVEVWDKFNIKTLGEYADLYLKVDVCLLAIVFENFRETAIQIYKLDPAHYYTAPGLSFDAMLRYTKVKIELLKDVDMLMLVERGKFHHHHFIIV